ncbi:interactor of constitutive active ROPs 4-like [Impatiens glandulifera]|uniref:interactor of constitutive active ROPs 4-like n=1 Tax=Impatiens glandulifera TaxID=253017 RepID=UPI001FB09423|nr:interactor of constitutive active ROPs 4-like [Impatiens glandulifera]
MQTPKSKAGSSDSTQKPSPRTARQLKVQPSPDSSDSKTQRSPKLQPGRRSPRSPASDQKTRANKLSTMESHLSQLQDELKSTKEQLNSSDSDKKQVQKELAVMTANFEESQTHLKEKQFEIESIQNQHSSVHSETLALVEKLKTQLIEAMETIDKTGMQLEIAKTTEQILKSELLKATEGNELLEVELEKLKAEKNKLDSTEVVIKSMKDEIEVMKMEMKKNEIEKKRMIDSNEEIEGEITRLRVQTDQWRKAAETAAAMVSGCGKFVERTGSLDINYNTIGGRLGSPFSDDLEDESPKKKNGGMFKKIGFLLKKRA